ncbi:MAG: hypothetical protein WC683_01910 [bacterium]
MIRAAALVLAALLAGACTPAIIQHAEQRNPGCRVVPLEREGNWARVRVICPGRMPVVREYGPRPKG